MLKILAYIFLFLFVLCLLYFASIRIPTGPPITIVSKVRYQVIDIGQGEFLRTFVESCFRHKRIFLDEPIDDIHWVYVKSKDHQKVWKETTKMREENYTYRATLSVKKLLLGGYTVAKLEGLERVEEPPRFSK